MGWRVAQRTFLALAIVGVLCSGPALLRAQVANNNNNNNGGNNNNNNGGNNNNNNNGGNNNNNNGGNNNGGGSAPQGSGVVVDANGVLRTQVFSDPTGEVTRSRVAGARASLDRKVLAPSKLRKISLNRLEQALRDKQNQPTNEMRYLAGLLRVRYVFFYPETKDIVLAGPAEGWATDASGRVRGITSGRPVIELQDLVVALRAFPPGAKGADVIGCSIDPTKEGLVQMQNFLRRVGARATPNDTDLIVNGLRQSLGLQKVTVSGVSPKTHFAQVLVEADYRMKLIGIGLERPPIRLVSYVERANPAAVARNAMQRWYFTPEYECLRVSEDRLGVELVGDGVKLIGADEMVTGGGERRQAAQGNAASRAFVTSFTTKYAELAERSPIYAQLRNLIDLAVAAAFIQEQDYYGKAGWTMETLGSEEALAVETYQSPQQVETAVASVWKGNRLMTPVGGGVNIQARQALKAVNLKPDEKGQVEKLRTEIRLDELAKGQWWWD
jgi:hypothetical protein